MHQNTLGGLSLAGMAGHGIAMIEMRMLIRINFYLTAIIHLQANALLISDAADCPQLTIGDIQFPRTVR